MLRKIDLIGSIQVHADNLRLASVLRLLARGTDLAATLQPIIEGACPTAFQPSKTLLENKPKLIRSADQLYLTLVRAAVTESLELTRDYCSETNQSGVLESQHWFHIFRIFRNALNHNFKMDFCKYDRTLLPLAWKNLSIEVGDNFKVLTQELLPPNAAIDWLSDLENFILNQLT
ncbi:hypothetical protein [Pseudomonas sp. BF-R-05]|uniref:hypothetical protein n=1 Tax=Pseudomonas sp. BF-R-05 TaxID=2832364 RepID=UPI001CC0A892|nr:hypothetical protein [Pseudomonas sp. BF-R-05]